MRVEACAHVWVIAAAAAAVAADWINGTGKAVDEEKDGWSFVDMLLKPWMIAAYTVVGFIALVSSILLWNRARR